MPKSGPRELAAYHQQILNKERKPMASTSFDTERMDPQAAETAAARVQRILATPPATAAPQQEAPATQPPAAEAPKRTRTTVAKIVEKYQEREAEAVKNIAEIESIIASYQTKLNELKFKLTFWREAIAEIEGD